MKSSVIGDAHCSLYIKTKFFSFRLFSMVNIAALITCYNRKDKTLKAISDLMTSAEKAAVEIDVFVVDGGSDDNTPNAVRQNFPSVNVIVADGLFWAGGMRRAWQEAVKQRNYANYLLLNDDTSLYDTCLTHIMADDEYCRKEYGKAAIVVGTTIDNKTKKLSYGGRRLLKKGRSKCEFVVPNNEYPQHCDLGNANIMLVPREVFEQIGMLSDKYTHGIADYDYTLRAIEKNFDVVVCKTICGECTDDHGKNWRPAKQYTLRQRIAYLYSPKGLAYREYLSYIKRFFPKEYFSAKIKLWAKTLCPSIWDKYK